MPTRAAFLLLATLLSASTLHAQALTAQQAADQAAEEGLWHGYDGELRYTTRLLISLAEAIPASKYSWRPAPGVRSVSELLIHIAQSNDHLLSVTGPPMPHALEGPDAEKTITTKPEVLSALKQSLLAVKAARAPLRRADLERPVTIYNQSTDVDAIYLRILCHANEHLGQLIAYARTNGITPPWSAGVVLPR